MSLSNIFVKVFCIKEFYKNSLDYCINSWVCNYGRGPRSDPNELKLFIFFSYFRFKYE